MWPIPPDRLCIYREHHLVAQHPRSYDRHGDFEHPDHPKPLLEQRKKARDHQLFMRFLALSPQAETYYRQLEQRRGWPCDATSTPTIMCERSSP